MGITRPMLEIDKFMGLVDLGRALRFVQDSEEIFKGVEVLEIALVHS
jgi:hypothetical protein